MGEELKHKELTKTIEALEEKEDCIGCTYMGSIKDIALTIPKDQNDERIITISNVGGYDTLHLPTDEDIFLYSTESEERVRLAEITEDDLYNLFVFMDANKFSLQTRETLVEYGGADEMNWYVEPRPIVSDNENLGMVGIRNVEVIEEDKTLRAIMFLSPDGTYTTLTAFGSDSQEEKDLAVKDLQAIALFLQNIKL